MVAIEMNFAVELPLGTVTLLIPLRLFLFLFDNMIHLTGKNFQYFSTEADLATDIFIAKFLLLGEICHELLGQR